MGNKIEKYQWIMKRKILCLAWLLSSLFCVGNAFANSKIVAVIDNDIITSNELDDRFAVLSAMNNMNVPEQDIPALKMQILSTLINEKIFLQEAKKLGIGADKDEVSGVISSLAEKKGVSVKKFMEELREKGISNSSVEEQIRNNLIWEKLLTDFISYQVEVSEEDIEDYVIKHNIDSVSVDAYVFNTSKAYGREALKKLHSQTMTCSKAKSLIDKKKLGRNIVNEKVKGLLSKINSVPLRKATMYAGIGSQSYIFENEDKFAFVVVCERKINLSKKEMNAIKYNIKMQKVELQAQYYMVNLKQGKFIELYELD